MSALLDDTCVRLARFIGERAARGDVVARGFLRGLSGTGHAPPLLPMVRPWLADVASERRLVRPHADPEIAIRLLSNLRAADTREPGAAERAWAELVARRRAGTG